jgi:hypothetical protein
MKTNELRVTQPIRRMLWYKTFLFLRSFMVYVELILVSKYKSGILQITEKCFSF